MTCRNTRCVSTENGYSRSPSSASRQPTACTVTPDSDLLGKFYRLLTLGSYDVSEHAMRFDRKWIFALAVIGIPAAHGLHGYVGFMYGSVKAREWWSSDLMAVIFLFSAIISGVSLLAVLYVVSCKLDRKSTRLNSS